MHHFRWSVNCSVWMCVQNHFIRVAQHFLKLAEINLIYIPTYIHTYMYIHTYTCIYIYDQPISRHYYSCLFQGQTETNRDIQRVLKDTVKVIKCFCWWSNLAPFCLSFTFLWLSNWFECLFFNDDETKEAGNQTKSSCDDDRLAFWLGYLWISCTPAHTHVHTHQKASHALGFSNRKSPPPSFLPVIPQEASLISLSIKLGFSSLQLFNPNSTHADLAEGAAARSGRGSEHRGSEHRLPSAGTHPRNDSPNCHENCKTVFYYFGNLLKKKKKDNLWPCKYFSLT